MLKKIIFFVVISFQLFATTTTRTTGIRVEFDEGALNKGLAVFFRSIDFPESLSGTVNGTDNYKISLELPTISIFENALKLNLTFRIDYKNYPTQVVTVNPTVKIKPITISSSRLQVQYEAVGELTQVINYSPIPAELKSIIISAYESLEPWVYPDRLLNLYATEFIDFVPAEITGVELGVILASVGNLVVNFNVEFTTEEPEVEVIFTAGSDLEVHANCKMTVTDLKLYGSAGDLLHHFYEDKTIPKNGYVTYYGSGGTNQLYWVTLLVSHGFTERYFVFKGYIGSTMTETKRIN